MNFVKDIPFTKMNAITPQPQAISFGLIQR